jgi:aminoglycoside 6'-N-acetyltransferase
MRLVIQVEDGPQHGGRCGIQDRPPLIGLRTISPGSLWLAADDLQNGREYGETVQVRVILRPLGKGDEAELWRIHAAPEVARWWDAPEEGFPWTDDRDATRLTIEVDGAVAGLIEFFEELTAKYRHATIDLFLDPALHGRGLGTEAVRKVVRHLIEDRGHHRITIDPATTNLAAIRTYEKVGFKPVGVMRSYERDADGGGWHDGLLMELLAGEP